MTENEVAQLQDLTEKRRWRDVDRMVQPQVRRKLDGSLFAVFLPLLTVKEYVVYKSAIAIVGKMRNPPPAAFDAILGAWQSTWTGSCPQCTIEALKALLALDSTNPRILEEIKHCLGVDNYQVHKACAAALMSIDNAEARQVLEQFEHYLPRPYHENLMIDLFAKIRDHLAD
jgi:hypothetical protein